MSLNDFPVRDKNSELAVLAESVFERCVVHAQQFVISAKGPARLRDGLSARSQAWRYEQFPGPRSVKGNREADEQ